MTEDYGYPLRNGVVLFRQRRYRWTAIGWMDGWMERKKDGWKNGWIYMERKMDRQMIGGWIGEWMVQCLELGLMNERINAYMDWMDGMARKMER